MRGSHGRVLREESSALLQVPHVPRTPDREAQQALCNQIKLFHMLVGILSSNCEQSSRFTWTSPLEKVGTSTRSDIHLNKALEAQEIPIQGLQLWKLGKFHKTLPFTKSRGMQREY
eukprot:Gb_31001 [translate_table: standard]